MQWRRDIVTIFKIEDFSFCPLPKPNPYAYSLIKLALGRDCVIIPLGVDAYEYEKRSDMHTGYNGVVTLCGKCYDSITA